MLSWLPLGATPIAYPGAAYDRSAPGAYELLLASSAADRIYLAELDLRDIDAADAETVRLGSRGFVSEPDDTPASTVWYPALQVPLRYRRAIDETFPFGGQAVADFGRLEIASAGGRFDALLDPAAYAWQGAAVRVLMGAPGFARTDFGTVFAGTMGDLRFGRDAAGETLSVQLRARIGRLELPIQTSFYGGTGGLDGTADLAGRPRPIAYGDCLQVEPVLVDPDAAGGPIYQIADKTIAGVDAVKLAGVASVTSAGTTSDITSGGPGAGNYRIENGGSNGGCWLQLGTDPQDQVVTVDIRGDASGAGYVDTPAEIAERIARDRAGLTADQVDAGAVTRAAGRAPWGTGIYIRDENPACGEAIGRVLRPAIAVWSMTRRGLWRPQVVTAPATPAARWGTSDTGDATLDGRIAQLDLKIVPPAWRIEVAYGRRWRPLAAGEVSAAVSAADRDALGRAYRTAVWEDASIRDDWPDARDITLPDGAAGGALPALADEADATDALDRAAALFGVPRRWGAVDVVALPFDRDLLETVTVATARQGLSSGLAALIMGLEEDSTERRVGATIWG